MTNFNKIILKYPQFANSKSEATLTQNTKEQHTNQNKKAECSKRMQQPKKSLKSISR